MYCCFTIWHLCVHATASVLSQRCRRGSRDVARELQWFDGKREKWRLTWVRRPTFQKKSGTFLTVSHLSSQARYLNNQLPLRKSSHLVPQSQLKESRFQLSEASHISKGRMEIRRKTNVPEFRDHHLLFHDLADHCVVERHLHACLVNPNCSQNLVGEHVAPVGDELYEFVECA